MGGFLLFKWIALLVASPGNLAIWQFGFGNQHSLGFLLFNWIALLVASPGNLAIWQLGYLAIWIWESALPRISPLQLDRTPRGVSGQFCNLAIWQFGFGNQHSLGFLLYLFC